MISCYQALCQKTSEEFKPYLMALEESFDFSLAHGDCDKDSVSFKVPECILSLDSVTQKKVLTLFFSAMNRYQAIHSQVGNEVWLKAYQ